MDKVLKITVTFLLAVIANIFCAAADVDILPVKDHMHRGCIEAAPRLCAHSSVVSDLHKICGLVDMLSPRNGIFLHNSTPTASAENPWRPTDFTRDAFKSALHRYVTKQIDNGDFESVLKTTRAFVLEELSPFNSKMFAWKIGMAITNYGFLELLRLTLLGTPLHELAKLIVKENFAVGVSLKDLNKWVEVREHLLRD